MKFIYSLFLILVINACTSIQSDVEHINPPADGFDEANSDPKAIAIANEVMEAMGGRHNYDHTRYIKFTFKGERNHIWDKKTGDIRIEYLEEPKIVLMNVHSGIGKAMISDSIYQTKDPRGKELLNSAKSDWINDTYWLVMPFKLKDSGVTLKYWGEELTQAGAQADVLSLTFKNVGVTPDNKYLIYIDQESRLVTQWDFYDKSTDSSPLFWTPWEGYALHGKILLSGGRGGKGLTNIEVLENLPQSVLSEF